MAEIGDKPLELHNHCTIGLAEPACLEAAELGVAAVQCASGGAADGTSNPPIQRMIANLRALGHTVEIDDEAVAEVARVLHRAGRGRGAADRAADGVRRRLPAAPAPRRDGRHDAPAPGRPRRAAPRRRGDRGDGPGARGARLADRDDPVRADAADPGGDERHRQGALRGDPRRDHPLRDRPLRAAQRADRRRGDGPDHGQSAHQGAAGRAGHGRAVRPAAADRRQPVRRGIPAARDDAGQPGRRDEGRRDRPSASTIRRRCR